MYLCLSRGLFTFFVQLVLSSNVSQVDRLASGCAEGVRLTFFGLDDPSTRSATDGAMSTYCPGRDEGFSWTVSTTMISQDQVANSQSSRPILRFLTADCSAGISSESPKDSRPVFLKSARDDIRPTFSPWPFAPADLHPSWRQSWPAAGLYVRQR